MQRHILLFVSCVILGTFGFRVFTQHPHRGTLNDLVFWDKVRSGEQQSTNVNDPPEQWLTQPVDHFDPTNSATWQQRYFVNDTFYKSGGPVFVMLGGEGPVSSDVVTTHFVLTDYAQKFNALVVAVEHRFYGKSVPTKDLSTENLVYLTSEQALADYAQFVEFINQKFNIPNAKWISFGGSYSGSLSAWFRLKYPHLIAGSIATSAPVKAQLNFPEYNEVVQQSLTYFSGSECAARVKEVTGIVTQLLQSQNGRSQVQSTFSTCTPIVTDNDVALFFSNLEGGIAEIVQYNNDNNLYTPFNINHLCDILTTGNDPLAAYAKFNNLFNTFSGSNCTQVKYNDYIDSLKDIRTFPDNDNAAGRSWTYQTCVEFGYFQTGDSTNQPFSNKVTLEWYQQQCKDIFNIESTAQNPMPNIDWTNTYYGSTNLESSNIVLPNGSIDPWHILGVQTAPNPLETVIHITGTAHCADLYPPRSSDLPELTAARTTEVALIQAWIAN